MGAVHETYLQAERALRWPGHLAPEERFELLLQYSRAANFTHPRLELAAEAAEQAVAVAQAQHDSVRQGRALLTLAWALWSLERVVQSREAVERALAVLEPTQDVAALARAHSARMRVEATAFDPAVAISEYPLTLDLATRAALDDVKLDATISFGLARGHRGLADGLDILWKALDAARAAGLTIQTVRTYVNLMTTAVSLRQHAVADRVRDEALPLFVEYRTAVPAMAVGAYHARSLLDRGRWDEAEAVFERSDSGWHGELPVARALLALIRARRGEPDCLGAAQAAWDGLCDMVPAESARHGMTRLAVVEVAWLEGAHEVAREHLRTGADSPSARRFARAAGELALWARRYGMPYEMPEQALAALVLELEGDWRGAIRAWRALEAPYEAALAALPGDDRAAREALATLHRLGARGAARAFDRERRARGARPARGPRRTTLANPAGLTRREQEVLEQLSTGATNSEIAATLHLSERTVAHHVSAVLAKLGARNRAAAIEHAHARGLLGQLRQPHSPR
jgi:DNA-binding CsgD family transcriptional regulator